MPITITRTGPQVLIRPPLRADAEAFIAAARASRRLHTPWVSAPCTPAQYTTYQKRYGGQLPTHLGFLVMRREDHALAGVFNLSEIVRGLFHSAYLGYYGFAPLAGDGYMHAGLELVLDAAFRDLKLHRVEANAQPANVRSIRLLQAIGFTREGYSRRYVKIGGRWRDHVRFAMLAEDWRALRRRR
jgi:ribosomal-protein-alanine N-acetyltransferase